MRDLIASGVLVGATDSGEFFITRQQFTSMSTSEAEMFETLLITEAHRRKLFVEVEHCHDGKIIRWYPNEEARR